MSTVAKKNRIFQIAKELNISHLEIMQFLENHGTPAESHMAPVSPEMYDEILLEFSKDKLQIERHRKEQARKVVVSKIQQKLTEQDESKTKKGSKETVRKLKTSIKDEKLELSDKLKDDFFKTMWNQASKLELPNTIEWPFFDYGETIATRKVWGKVIEELAGKGTFLVGGSADLEPSNVTVGFAKMVGDFSKDNQSGMNFPYGVREFPMGAINNGIALHGGLFVFGATFFVFADYERPAIRLRALQKLPVISEFTHDSIYVGEDGPTHQPIEHLMSYRAIPNLLVLRPADANEAVVAAKIAFESKSRPSLVLLTRQGLPVFDRDIYPGPCSIEKGGYIMCDHDNPDVLIIATGSEVWIALEVKEMLKDLNMKVVNLACWELFEDQDESYKNSVLKCGDSTLMVSVEAGITDGWQKYTGRGGLNIGINTFGESAPGKVVADHFGLNSENVANKIKDKIK